MKSLCGLSLWTKDCCADTAFQTDSKKEKREFIRYAIYNMKNV